MRIKRLANLPFTAIFLICALEFFHSVVVAQCTNGTQPECRCTTAPVLCTIDELDAYTFSMSSFQHPQDAPSPLCPPQTGTVSNNPTWFAFVAWCTSLTLEVNIENCTPFQGGINGVQIAIYSSCDLNDPDPVACNTSASDCNTNDKTLSMDDLVIGNTYYFLIDGCAGAYCDVEIDVVGVCGEAMIEDWTQGIDGPTEICAGSSESFSVESLHGATDYHWYIDGVLIDEGNEMIEFTHLWATPGTYEICVDASNVPCIPESDPPEPICLTVMVFDADAGMIQATPTPVCPNDDVMITATGFNSAPGYEQYIVIADASGTIVEVVSGSATTFTHDDCASFTAYSYNIHEASGNPPPDIGDPVAVIDCADGCCDSDMAPFEFIDDVNPVLLNIPADVTLSCFDLMPPMPDLNWTDNCDGSGSVPGDENGIADLCDGGLITREWEYTDGCGNTVQALQMIVITALPEAEFVNPPADITVDCASIPSSAPALIAMNSGTGGCAISEMVPAVQNGTADECGGSFSFTWEYTDECDRTITHTQNVTVTPLSPPVFDPINEDLTVECNAIPTTAPDLNYSNGETGPCAITGSVPAVISGSADLCGGNVRFTWTFTDQCGNNILATQNFTVLPVVEATFINPPADITVSCDAIPISQPSLDYSNGESGNCLISGSVIPSVQNNVDACGGTITVNWQTTDPCGRNLSHTQVITVTPAPPPVWINPPGDTTIDCAMLPTNIPDLSYSNGQSGVCTIAGSVPGIQTTFDICQGIVEWEWSFTDACGNSITHTRTINTNPPPPVVFNNPPADITVACLNVPTSIPPLTYTNNSAGACLVEGTSAGTAISDWDLCGGTIERRWEVTDPCGVVYSVSQIITVAPAPPSMFLNPPPDVTLECDMVPAEPPSLLYSNGMPQGPCAQVGSVPASLSGSYNSCGGQLTYRWETVDYCGNALMHIQNVTVLPAPLATFDTDTIPPFITISCNAAAAIPLELPYSNGASGLCAFEGTDSATVTGTLGPCGGPLIFEWSVEDSCGNVISFTHGITALPAVQPDWVDPPPNDTLVCFEEYEPPFDLLLTNNLTNECEHTVWVTPEVLFVDNVHIHTWSYLSCNDSLIEYVQYVYDFPEPEIEIEPLNVTVCFGDTFDLSTINVIEANGDSLTITYHTGSPPTQGNKLNSPLVVANTDDDFVLLATNASGCTDEAVFEIAVLPLPNAGDDASENICQTETVDLENIIDSDVDYPGTWLDVDGAGVDLDNINSISFANVPPGVYHFLYYVSINECPADTAIVTLNLSGPPPFTVDSVFCNAFHTEYTVVILGMNLGVDPSHGTVVIIPGGLQIEGIPIDQQLTFDIYDVNIQCFYTFYVTPPNCDCPSVPAPVNLGDVQICIGDPNPVLAVTIDPGFTANWYTVPVGGAPLASGTTTYTPGETLPGIYIYYVEGESIDVPGCVSSVRTPVTFEISPEPEANDLNLDFCDDAETGIVSVNLSDWATSISGNLQASITFHASMGDAEAGINALTMPVSAGIGTTDYFARVVDQDGCVAVAIIEVMVHGLPVPLLQVIHESCIGESDGSVVLTGLDLSQQYSIELDDSVYTNVFQFEGLAPGAYELTVTNTLTTCTKMVTFAVNPGIQPLIANPALTCNDNGTDTDPADDFYSVEIVVNSGGSTNIYQLIANGVAQGYYAYGNIVPIQLPANGAGAILIAIDTTLGCSDTLVTALLNPCSSACDLILNSQDQTCSDNGTPVDPSDDYHTIMLNVSAINGAPSNQYAVYLNGLLTYLFDYGVPESFDLPVSAPVPTIQLQDAADPQCFLNLTINPLISCSNQCVIPTPDVQYTCDNNGTAGDVTDDFYSIIFIAEITNPGTSGMAVILVDGNPIQTVLAGASVTLTLPADGATHVIQITDQDQPSCSVQWTSIALLPCSTLCIITVNSSSVNCNDNGTPLIPGDDFYDIQWNATAVFGATSLTYRILVDGSSIGNGVYGTDEAITLPADGLLHTLELQDLDDANCRVQIPLPVLVHCSDACSITVNALETYCDNNGTNQTDADDIFYVVVQVDGANISSGTWSVPAENITGALGERDTLGPYLIANGDPQIIFSAVGASCGDTIVPAVTATCSECLQSIEAGPDVTLDCGMPTAQLTVTSSHPGTAVWTDPGGGTTQSNTINVSIAGQYIATVSFSDGCVFSDTLIVTADPLLPSVWGGMDQYLNCVVSQVILNAEIITGNAGSTYEWTDGSGNVISMAASVVVTQPGTYFIRIYDPIVDCWSGKDEVEVFDITNDPSAVIYANPGNILSCVIGFIELSHDDEINVQYTWVAQGVPYNDNTLTVYEGGTVTLIALDTISECESRDSITIEELIDYPFIIVNTPLPLTCERTSVTLDASGSIPTTGGSFIWTDLTGDTIGTMNMLSVQNAGTYILELSDPANGCTSTDTIVVEDISEVPEIADALDIELPCDLDNGVLSMTLVSALPGIGVQWSTVGGQILGSTTGNQISFDGPGTYIVEVTHLLSECTDSDTIIVTQITDGPDAIIAQVTPANCEDVSDGIITLGSVQGGTPPYTIYVNGVETTSAMLTDLEPGAYLIQVEDMNGCLLDTTLNVLTGEEVMVDLETRVTIVIGEDHVLIAGVNIPGSEISSVQWTPGQFLTCDTCLTTQAMPVADVTYTIVVTDIYGCTGEAEVTFRVIDDDQVYVPNVISPSNRDQVNDAFTVFTNNENARVQTMRIFDRWGAIVFERFDFSPNDPAMGWDGTFNGETLNPAVFVYMIELEMEPGLIELLKGDVTIVR